MYVMTSIMAAGRLHLHTDGLYHHRGGSSSFDQADYAAVTPTAARPHPEQHQHQQGAGLSLYDSFIPPQYAYPQHRFNEEASSVVGGSASPFPVFHGGHYQQEHQQAVPSIYEDTMARGVNPPLTALSSCSSSSENSYSSSGASSTDPSSSQQSSSSMGSPAFSSNGVPGNTIYNSNAYTIAYPQFTQNALSAGYPSTVGSNVANEPALMQGGQYNHQQDVHQQALSVIAYNHHQHNVSHPLAYPPYQPGYYVSLPNLRGTRFISRVHFTASFLGDWKSE